MRSHGAAVAWEIRQRHRWGLIAVAFYLVALATFKLLLLWRGQPLSLDDEQVFAFAVVVPSGATFGYLLAVFSFGFAGDLAGRRSIYPARMFTLPVTSGSLAGWPMLYGTAAVTVLWLATRLLAVWPSDSDAPVIWPAALAAAILAWTQAMTWMPYALPALRVVVTVLILVLLVVVVVLALYWQASEPVMLAILTATLPLAFVVARFAVARARRGDVPDRRRISARLGRIAGLLPTRRDRFRSPAEAQAWFEWRHFGRSLPTLVGVLVPLELSLLFLFGDTPAIVFETLLAALLTPPFLAVFVAATVSTPSLEGSGSYGVTPFTATRPVTSASLIAAKLKAAIWSTLAAWLLVIVAIPLALSLSGASSVVVDGARRLNEVMGTPRAVGLGLLGLSALVASTWKQLVQSLCIGMSGRAWLVKGSVFLALSLLTVFVVLARYAVASAEVIAALWKALPWTLAILVGFKISTVAWIALRLHDSRLLRARTLVVGAVAWNVEVLVLSALLVWLVPNIFVGEYLLVLVAILAVPLARLSAAPLVLSWNRHR